MEKPGNSLNNINNRCGNLQTDNWKIAGKIGKVEKKVLFSMGFIKILTGQRHTRS